MKLISLFLTLSLLIFINNIFSQTAGITSVGSYSACPNTIIYVPVKVLHSPKVSAISLSLIYDGSVLSAVTNSNGLFMINLNASVPNPNDWGSAQSDFTQIPGMKQAKFGCLAALNGSQLDTDLNGVAKLCDIQFKYYGGTTNIVFDNSLAHGGNCEYADSNGNALIDTPSVVYYIPGTVSPDFPAVTGGISGNQWPCSGSVAQYSVASSYGVTYFWNAPNTWSGTSISNSITYYVGNFTYDSVYVTPLNACGYGVPVSLQVTECSLGISPIDATDGFMVRNYPNPFATKTYLSFKLIEPEVVSYDIYNPLGIRLLSITGKYFDTGDHDMPVDLSGYPAGTYILRACFRGRDKFTYHNSILNKLNQ